MGKLEHAREKERALRNLVHSSSETRKNAKAGKMEAKRLAKEERKATVKLRGLHKVLREKRLKMERVTTTLRKVEDFSLRAWASAKFSRATQDFTMETVVA